MSNPFDRQFEDDFGKAWGETGAELMTYTGPGGAPVVTDVPVTLDETREDPGGAAAAFGGQVARKRTGSAFRSRFMEEAAVPVQDGTFTCADGSILRIGAAPEGPDSAGEYHFDFG